MTQSSSERASGPVSTAELPAAGERPTLDLKLSASPNFARLLAQQRMSLLVSTYDAGKLIVLRAAGETLNVHFIGVGKAMGVAANISRLAVGTGHRIQELYNMPTLCPKLPRSESAPSIHDACYVPRNSHVTGEIDIHEMAWAGDVLWFVNTRFSCLCTLDSSYSFTPQWRPPFVKGLSADDRCHLNGLAMIDDRPAYVTAFAASDEPEGWRPQRTTGGILIKVASGEVIVQGLCMPHSPRFYDNELWLLESGLGSLARVDRASGKLSTVAEFSGFTRGLDFWGTLAFVGLSQVRESKVFGGLPLTDRLQEGERFCGIQVLNLAPGQQEAFLKFESGVHEIFAVQVLPGIRFPEILEEDDPLVAGSVALSPAALAQVR